MFLFKPKKQEEPKAQVVSKANADLEIITKMNQEFASSLDLNETLNTALKVIIERINAQAANIFLINEKIKKFECIASLHQDYLDEYQLDLKDGVMGKAVEQKKCIRVGDVRKDVREIANFYFDLDNKTNFTTFSVLCSPLIAANECIGVIHCLNKKTSTKLFEEGDRQLLETLSAPAAFAIRNAKMAKEMIEKNKIQKEVEIVGDIQKSLLSKNKKEDFPIAGINIPAKVVSGDFYNFSDLGDGKYGFGVADVSGKGIKSSLLMSKASSLYSCLSKTNFSAAELLIQLNNEICETISRGMFVTMLIGIYDSNKKELLLSSAGHEPPIIFSKDGTFTNYNESGPPLGIMPKTKYTEHTIPFDNSSMYIFTDGITEIKNPKGEMLGSEGFQNYIKKYKDKPNNERLKIIIEDILNTGHIQKDDLTIVVIDGNN
ncbi:GAF domain-containing SpoIIE family protein phosphatase [Candidatus Pelagibacter sp. RS40]|uniref:GAF domain-containing SpoIIE family protein phosphatase n=1 Tax=Candidatus Pelagibacter sp. RS40 TaxID=1977865 RepID=UPI000A160E16|nr:GAF domain-containing SpoIIE family protein phosphatase [Candidatus Pelagibacter sp. RS40]ARJ49327.1 sigma factor sigB regulation protein [Candidatus Pelagibacter sp. RS40]MDC3026086.1 SpoIIE family protein phosphatase [Candidatus Pelagibacter sp.]